MVEKDFNSPEKNIYDIGAVNSAVDGIDPEKKNLISKESFLNPFLCSIVSSVSRELNVSRAIPSPLDYSSYITDVYHRESRRDIDFSKRLIIIESPDFNIILIGLFGKEPYTYRNFRVMLFSGKNEKDQKDSGFKVQYRNNGLEMEELTLETHSLMLEEIKRASLRLSKKPTLRERLSRTSTSLLEMYGRNYKAGSHGNRWG